MCSSYNIEEEINDLKTVKSMLSCGALKRSNNPYIESTVEPCVSKNQKEIFSMLVWQGKKILKKEWGNGKKYPWAESGICVFVCEREKQITALKLL